MKDVLSYKITNTGPVQFNFFINHQNIGYIRYYIEYNQITIIWLCILLEQNHNKGYGSLMLKMFIEYLNKNKKMNQIINIVLIPDKFDGHHKNILCKFYEKNGFIQEIEEKPFYVFNLKNIK
jgi:hypothetical protein